MCYIRILWILDINRFETHSTVHPVRQLKENTRMLDVNNLVPYLGMSPSSFAVMVECGWSLLCRDRAALFKPALNFPAETHTDSHTSLFLTYFLSDPK